MTTPPGPTITDDLLAEIEAAAKCAHKYNFKVSNLENEASFPDFSDGLFMSNPMPSVEEVEYIRKTRHAFDPATILALVARVRELEEALGNLGYGMIAERQS